MLRCLALGCFLLTGLAQPSEASLIFTGSGTNTLDSQHHGLSAKAEFNVSGTNLIITLSNTYAFRYDVGNSKMVPSDILTALFFDIVPDQVFKQANPFAVVAPGSTIVNGTGGAGTNVTAPKPTLGGWEYNYDSDNAPLAQNQGLGTAGFGIFYGKDVNQGLGGPFNYGLVNPSYVAGDGNPAVKSTPFVESSIVFTLTGLSAGFVLTNNSIQNVRFQYGTALTDGSVGGSGGVVIITGGGGGSQGGATPEPSSIVLLGSAAGMLVCLRRKQVANASAR